MTKAIKRNYTEPKVSTSGKVWYVWFRYLDETTGKQKLIVRKGGNYSHLPVKDKIKYFNDLSRT